LQGVPTYDILANPFYRRKFCYVECSIPDRVDYCISQYSSDTDPKKVLFSADIVRLVCDMAYLGRKKVMSLEFDADYYVRNFKFVEEEDSEKKSTANPGFGLLAPIQDTTTVQ